MFISVENVSKSYKTNGRLFKKSKMDVLNHIYFQIKQGECVGLIGESGSGKSTLSNIMLGLEKAGQGSVWIEGEPVSIWAKKNRGKMSVVFQDYTSSVNPQYTIRSIIAEPLIALGMHQHLDGRITALLHKVGLPSTMIHKYPHELSGGQLQRVCIARAIATEPAFIVLDEAVSSLDASSQAEILQLLRTIKEELHVTYLFVAHDLQVVANICDRILFLYQGEIVEELDSTNLIHVQHDYAKKLLRSVMPFTPVFLM